MNIRPLFEKYDEKFLKRMISHVKKNFTKEEISDIIKKKGDKTAEFIVNKAELNPNYLTFEKFEEWLENYGKI